MARVLLLLKGPAPQRAQIPAPEQCAGGAGERRSPAGKVLRNTAAYLTAYCVLTLGSFLLVSLDGFSVEANISAVFCLLQQHRPPAWRRLAPSVSFAAYSAFSKVILTMDMLFGPAGDLPYAGPAQPPHLAA